MDDPLAPSPAPVALDVAPDPALPALFGAAIGNVGTQRYLPLFAQFDADGKSRLGWNWAACLCTFNWMIFRHLWLSVGLYAVTLLVLPLMLVGVGRLLLQWSGTIEWAALLGCAALAFAVPALLGDRLLYQHCRNDITRALESTPTLQAACSALAQRAPSRIWLQRQVMINLLVLGMLAAVGYLTWPKSPAMDDIDAAPIPIQPASKPLRATSAPASTAYDAQEAAASAPASAVASAPASATEPALAPALMQPSEPASAALSAQGVTTPAAPPSARVTASATKGFVINVGLFADPDNARHAYVKLVKAGLPAQREMLLFKGKKVTRVRAGPFGSRAKATVAVHQIKAMQLDAVLSKP